MTRIFNNSINGKGFTLVEVMISLAVASMLLISIFYTFSHNLQSWQQGEKKMVLQSEISRVMYVIYQDLKRINPAIFYDQNFDLWVTGERYKEAKPNEIEILDENKKTADGFERIKFKVYYIEPYSKKETVEYYLKRDANAMDGSYVKNKRGSAHVLIRTVDDRETVVSENVESIKFSRDKTDPKALNVSVRIIMPTDAGAKVSADAFDLKVRFDNDYTVLREVASGN